LPAFWLIYALLFRLLGLGYSLSAVNKEAYLNSFFLRDMLAGATALLFAAFCAGMIHRPECSGDLKVAATSVRMGAAVSLLVSVVLAILVLSAWWFDGLWTGWWLPNLKLGFMVYLHLLVMFALCFAVWPAILAAWLASRAPRGSGAWRA
jgi:hypothetical protein